MRVEPIPIVLLTGFLGSGKTTLLAQALSDPAMGDALVLVNELGSVGLDHDLLWAGGEVALSLDNGCICCSVSDDLITLLRDLFWKRLHRSITRFSRVVIETTGIADPYGILTALQTNPLVADRYRYAGTVTVIDAHKGMELIRKHDEALAQAAIADRIVLSHADATPQDVRDRLRRDLQALNGFADIVESERGSAGNAGLFDVASKVPTKLTPHTHAGHRHIDTFAIALRADRDLATVHAALEALGQAGGPNLLRAKGLVLIDDQLFVIQMVGKVITSLDPVNGPVDHEGFLVVIGKGMDVAATRAVLAGITHD
ncbi:CobW family GTP-binding protein [Pelagibacterium luteolum]|uniref:GTPase, G3E family n=1 Tax=Pelagibacterium luteolum TaxID=440168 RepID=A0A1G7SYB1_9HYPH|nr:GTP-binding protein [Pelagibacterium luteolum]SDG27409.1 GTPase, G3E family [Pelagibacterium luteolum]